MKKIFLLTTLLSLTLSSCFIADNMFLENEIPKESLDTKVKNEISTYIKENSENYIYKNYGFSELVIKKPAELIVLDDLKRQLKTDSNQTDINAQIIQVENIIKEKNLRYNLEMDHVYSLKNKQSGKIELFETQFTLADSIKVKSITPLLNAILSTNDVSIFEDYFYEKPIFSTGTYSENKALSIQFYNFLKQHQNELTSIVEKSKFLSHSLKLCKEIKTDGSFDQDYYVLKITDIEMSKDSTLLNYTPLEYSPLFETIINEKLVNYHFFHSFINSPNGISDTSSVYIEFSPYYELRSISEPGNIYNNNFND